MRFLYHDHCSNALFGQRGSPSRTREGPVFSQRHISSCILLLGPPNKFSNKCHYIEGRTTASLMNLKRTKTAKARLFQYILEHNDRKLCLLEYNCLVCLFVQFSYRKWVLYAHMYISGLYTFYPMDFCTVDYSSTKF